MRRKLSKLAIEAIEGELKAPIETEETLRAKALAQELSGDGLEFAKHFFAKRTGNNMIIAPHHISIQKALQQVISGEVTRLIINLPPGYTKTELATINMIAYGLALNPRSRFLHLSYSHNLALLNSSRARDIIKMRDFQGMWPMALRADADSKAMWWTEHGGGVYASSSSGQVTGFRAGHMEAGFNGALIIDDPVKPDDAFSEVMREGVNNGFNETIKSRLAIETTPLIVIMQRIHYNDLSGYLLRGGSGEKWHHLNLPVMIDNSKPYPIDNTHGIEIKHGLDDGWLWPYKHNETHYDALSSHRRTFEAQYMQTPRRFNAEGALWTEALIAAARLVQITGTLKRCVIGVDPAITSTANSDETGIVACSSYSSDQYSVDGDYSGTYTPEGWAKKAMEAYTRHDADAIVVEVNQGGDMAESVLRLTGFKGRIVKVRASKGKYARAEPISALYEQRKVHHAGNLYHIENQMMEYVPAESSKSPDRMDALVWALTDLAPLGPKAAVFM